ncbi:MAG: FHA domain-containing protein [Anaerolineae bacterium]|nr:FHA domain-containing protein [Anaerolineae bacterium]
MQSFFEGLDFVSTKDRKISLVRKIADAMTQIRSSIHDPGTQTCLITIQMPPHDYQAWMAHSDWIQQMACEIQTAAEETMLTPFSLPLIKITSNQSISDGEVEVTASVEDLASGSGNTSVITVGDGSLDSAEVKLPEKAYLILNGVEQLALMSPVINLGRQLDNQIVLDDPRVSRTHAQLRASNGRYVIFDLGSSGGTYVNNQRISQQTLKPGDVISLAGYLLIYGEESQPGLSDTDKFSTGSQPEIPEN